MTDLKVDKTEKNKKIESVIKLSKDEIWRRNRPHRKSLRRKDVFQEFNSKTEKPHRCLVAKATW